MDLNLDMSALTLGDMEDFEEITGVGITDIAKYGEKMPTKVILGIIYIVRRKTEPTITLDEIRQMKINELDINLVDSSTDPQ